jgi:hypothetical protein
MSEIQDMNKGRSGNKIFLGVDKTNPLVGEDRIFMAELVAF